MNNSVLSCSKYTVLDFFAKPVKIKETVRILDMKMAIENEFAQQNPNQSLSDVIAEKHLIKNQTMQKKAGFESFLTIFSSVREYFAQKKQNQKYDALKKEQEEMAQGFLDTQMYEPYLTMVKNGYKPPVAQQIIMDSHCNNLLSASFIDGLNKIDKYNQMGMPISRTLIGPLLLNHVCDSLLEKGLLNNEKDYQIWGLTYFSEEYKKALQAETLPRDLMLFWKTTIQKHLDLIEKDHLSLTSYKDQAKVEVSKINEAMNRLIQASPERFIGKTPMKDMMEIISINQKLLSVIFNHDKYDAKRREMENLVKEELPQKISRYYRDEIASKMQLTRSIYNNDLQEMALQKAQENLNNPQYNVLPEKAQEKVKQIEELYQTLHAGKSASKIEHAISAQEEFEIENVFQRRLPEVLEKYLSIHQDYRDSMKHMQTGKTAYEMMMESLENYQLKLQTILDNRTQDKLSDMNATSIYSKKINNI